MDVKLVDRGSEGELTLAGRLDANSSAEAGELFLSLADRFRDITLDLKDLYYISSAGLRVLARLHRKVRTNGGELVCKNVDDSVVQVFEMTGFSDLLRHR